MPSTKLIVSRPRGFWPRLTTSIRSYWNRGITGRDLDRWLSLGERTKAGVTVSEESALTFSAVWSALTLVSDDIASLPLHLYRKLPNGGKDRYEAHPLYELLHNEPNHEMTTMVLRRTMQAHVMLWGNAYAEIERDGVGRPVALWPLLPERVQPLREGLRLFYRVAQGDGSWVDVQASDMVHLVGPSPDGSVGYRLVQKARESLALGLAAEQFGSTFFGNGATFGGVVISKGAKPPEKTEKEHHAQLSARHQGVDRAHKLLLLYNDASYVQTGVPPDSAQFLETRTFQIREVARWWKIPPHKLADLADATYSNVEQQNLDYYTSCLRPWLTLWEQELTRKLVARLERRIQFIEHDTHGFLRADAAGRAAIYSAEFGIGSVVPNEIRGYENRDPIPGGDEAFVQGAYMPLSLARDWWQAQIDEKRAQIDKLKEPAPEPAHPDPQVVPVPPTDEQMHAFLDVVTRAVTVRDDTIAPIRQEAEAARSEAVGLRAVLADRESQIETLQRENERRALEAAGLALTATAASRETTDALSAMTQARDAVQTQLAEALDRRDAALAEADAARQAQAEADARAQREADAAESAKQAAAQAAQARADVIAREAARQAAVLPALRAVTQDTMARLVRREVEKAKRHQSTPQKLRAWAGTFYADERDIWIAALTPVVRMHLAWRCEDQDAEAVAASLVDAHFAASRQQVQAVALVEDFPAQFARMLDRWEVARPQAVADRVIREGVAYVAGA